MFKKKTAEYPFRIQSCIWNI